MTVTTVLARLSVDRARSPAAATMSLRRYAVIGVLAVLSLVIAAGRAATPVGVVLESAFGGLLHPSNGGGTISAATVLVALAVLVACWWRILRLAGQGQVSLRAVGWTGVIWLLPVLFAPPLLSLDAYAYLAQGHMLATGLDPYSGGPVLLGGDSALIRVDPMWRASPVPYGPLALLLLRAVDLAHGDLTVGIMLLRGLALLGVLAAVGAALRLAPAQRRPYVLALSALNPITLVHLIGGAHVDAVLAGVVGLSLLALRRNRPWLAWLLASCAVAVKITVAPLLLFVLIALWRHRRGAARWSQVRAALAVLALAALPFLAPLPVVHRPWGFLPALTVPGSSAPWYAPATLLGDLLIGLGRLLLLPLDSSVAHALGRLAALLIGAAVVLSLARAEVADQRPSHSRQTVARASAALLVVSLCLPAVYGWYLAAALFGLAAVAGPAWTGALVALSSALTFSSLPPLYAASRWPLVAAWAVALAALGTAYARSRQDPHMADPGRLVPAAGVLAVGHRRYIRLAQVAGLGLMVPATVGLLSPGANAGVAGEQAQSERTRVVKQLLQDYPRLQLVSVVPSTSNDEMFDIQLVWPGQRTCDLVLTRGVGPRIRFDRQPEDPHERRVSSAQERPCALPHLAASSS